MAGRDGFGPMGQGYRHYGYGGFGRFRGRGFGPGFPMAHEDQNLFLERRQELLEAELERIKELRGRKESGGGSMEAEA